MIDRWYCRSILIWFVHCTHPPMYSPSYFWTRYPLPTTRMWNLLSIFDIPAYICFFTSLTLTVVFMKFYTYLGSKMGLESVTEEFILIPIRSKLIIIQKKFSYSNFYRFQVPNVENSRKYFSPGFSFRLLYEWHCIFGGILL